MQGLIQLSIPNSVGWADPDLIVLFSQHSRQRGGHRRELTMLAGTIMPKTLMLRPQTLQLPDDFNLWAHSIDGHRFGFRREGIRKVPPIGDGDMNANGRPMAENKGASARAEHGDRRFEERREKYGDLADLTVEQLQQKAAEQGIKNRSGMRKDELLEALTGSR